MLDICLAEVLCMFAEPYGSYMSSLCNSGEEVVQLLQIAGADFPENFRSQEKCSSKDLISTHEWVIQETQEHFFARKGERHEAALPEWISKNSDKIEQIATVLLHSMSAAKNIEAQNPDCIAILGASKKEFEKRINFLSEFHAVDQSHIYLLAGTRKLWDRELTKQEQEEWSTKYKGHIVTEALMMQEVFAKKYPNIEFNLISTEPCNGASDCIRKRANTEDTVEAFLDTNPNCNTLSFVSRAPNIVPQYEAVRPVMEARAKNIHFNVVGGGASIDEIDSPDAKQHMVYHILMPFAGALWGSFERVSAKISEKVGQCPASYEYLYGLKYKMKENFVETKKTNKNLKTPL